MAPTMSKAPSPRASWRISWCWLRTPGRFRRPLSATSRWTKPGWTDDAHIAARAHHRQRRGRTMLSTEDNEILCRVGPGTPMGTLMRHYWIPGALSSELSEPDGAPMRLRLLGEDLIAFRVSSGQIGVIQNNCPHRGASLFFGRNEEEGLRCVYHGWKFNTEGACVDMPNEPPESNFKHKVKVTAYPFVEKGGVIWAYMGQENPPPP